MVFTRYVPSVLIVLSILTLVSSAPSKQNIDHGNLKQKELLDLEKQFEDEEVRELKKLEPAGSSATSTKIQKMFYSNKNGEKEQNIVATKQVNQNGKVLERIRQNVNSKQEPGVTAANTHVRTDIELPLKGVHKVYEDGIPQIIYKKNYDDNRLYNMLTNNLLQTIKSNNIIRFTPEEMAEYIYETADENTVTTTIENYLQNGLLTQEEALWYLQQIRSILSSLEEQEIRDKKQEQRKFFEALYSNPKNGRMDVAQALSDLHDIQQLIQEKYVKKFKDNGNDEGTNFKYDRNSEEAADADEVRIYEPETGYRNLAGKLQNFENVFSKTSMEGVIYQLAKILFYQSFSTNGIEAQESIKQFTTFLERQVMEGHVSRNVERKVFNILLVALSDTLDEHPELFGQKIKAIKFSDVNIDRIPEPDSSKLRTLNKAKDKNKMKYPESVAKSLDLKSSGIRDDTKSQPKM